MKMGYLFVVDFAGLRTISLEGMHSLKLTKFYQFSN